MKQLITTLRQALQKVELFLTGYRAPGTGHRKSLIPTISLCWFLGLIPGSIGATIPFLDMDLKEVRELAGQQGTLYFAFFTADWCAPCRWMEEHAFLDNRLGDYVQQRYLAVRVDIDQRSGRVHQERFQVKILPSILIFNAQGQLLARIETAISGADLLGILKEHDLPKNRIGSATSTRAPEENILDSPKPAIRLYRPPLATENSGNSSGELPPPVVLPAAPAPPPAETPPVYRSNREEMAPRSGHTFSIRIAVCESYEQAVRQVGQLEAGYKEPVRLLAATSANGQQEYRIFIGLFAEKKKAEEYLFYLRRKNMSGVIEELR